MGRARIEIEIERKLEGRLRGKKRALRGYLKAEEKSLAATYSPTLLCAVPSAMKGLTSEFGMGSGISPSP
jgi:hypothetical protein